MRDDGVIYFEKINPSFTYMPENSELFKLITVELEEDMVEFIHHAKQTAVAQQGFIEGIKREDLIYITSLPWISFTQITHTMSKDKTDTVPRVSWGKYFRDEERILMPFSVQVHHSFVDGIHISKYIECLQKYMDEYI
jgi:chloramphenicol O-acetyltransferase type A